MDLEANLRYFRDRYDSILAERYARFDGLASVRGTQYRRVQRLHHDYILEQKAEVETMLTRLQMIPADSGSEGVQPS